MNLTVIIPGNIMEMFIIFKFWFSLMELRFNKKLSVAIFVIVASLNTIRSWMMFDTPVMRAILTHIIFLGLMHLLFRDKFYKKLVIHTIYMVCVMLAEFVSMIFAKYIYHHDLMFTTDASLPTFLWQGTTYVLAFIFTTIALLLLKNKKIDSDDKLIQYAFLYTATQCLMVFILTMFIFEYKIRSTFLILLIAFAIIASFAVGILIYKTIKYATLKAAAAEFLKAEADIKDKHFKDLKSQYMEYRRLRHDFLNHIKIIDGLSDANQIKEYTDEIKEKFIKMEQVSFCDNLTLDALLVLKLAEGKSEGVVVEYEICSLADVTIPNFDLCTVVSNILDNAICAAKYTEDKRVKLQINIKSARLIIVAKNSSNPVDMKLETTKEDAKNHGIGIDSVKAIAEKYDGNCVFKYDRGEFTVIINLML